MIRLDTTTRKLQALLSGAVTTNQLPINVNFSDQTTTTYAGGSTVINTNDTTPVDICAAPAGSTVRDIDYVNIVNADTTEKTITIRYNDNGTSYSLGAFDLAVGDQLQYIHGSGWKTLDSTGAIKNVTVTEAGSDYALSYLIVAGGGGGGGSATASAGQGGGGGGGVIKGALPITTGQSYSVIIGTGGAGGAIGTNNGVSGVDSSLVSEVAIGGGGGGSSNGGAAPGLAGGSSGGGAFGSAGGTPTSGQGYTGGTGSAAGTRFGGAGGGGGSAIGANGSGSGGGNGGAGWTSSISGTATVYAGGGGGGSYNGGTAGTGGTGGGGAGGAAGAGTNGTANTGGGGGGSGASAGAGFAGGNGGSGVVILSYVGSQRGTGGTVTTSNGNTIHTFTTSGTYTG
jgi:hypothetical protein